MDVSCVVSQITGIPSMRCYQQVGQLVPEVAKTFALVALYEITLSNYQLRSHLLVKMQQLLTSNCYPHRTDMNNVHLGISRETWESIFI